MDTLNKLIEVHEKRAKDQELIINLLKSDSNIPKNSQYVFIKNNKENKTNDDGALYSNVAKQSPINTKKSSSPATEYTDIKQHNNSEDTTNPGNNEWITQRKRRRPIYGTATETQIKASVKYVDFHVYRLEPQISEQLTHYLQSKGQHSMVLGTMYDIPAKIHYEIFGGNGRLVPAMSLPSLNRYSFTRAPLQTQKRSLYSGLTYNSVAYGVGGQQMLGANNSTMVDRIPLASELFAPAIVKFPAATKGQIEAYMKALDEESKEAEKNMNMQIIVGPQIMLDTEKRTVDPRSVSYVNVKLGGNQNVNYHYTSI
ncbi:hypothetical protein MML48_7g00018357 [Holotrichia oblita]|nr:hypothetical protein MML48_7g00018357 [Holotrichia oblita]